MRNNMTVFSFCENEVRTIRQDDQIFFVGKDVCQRLGYVNHTDAINTHCRGVAIYYPIVDSIGRNQEVRIISESDLMRLICASKLPEAQKFERWVFDEVLPSIRKTGGYIASTGSETLEELTYRAMTALQAAVERQKLKLEEQEKQLKLQAPAVEYCQDVLSASNLHTVNSVAVHLGCSAKRLNQFLIDQAWIYKQGDLYCPSCKIRDKGYCDYHVVPYINRNGEKMTREHLKWTKAGRRAIIELWNSRNASR